MSEEEKEQIIMKLWKEDYAVITKEELRQKDVLIQKQQTEIEQLKQDFDIVDHECERLEKIDIEKDITITKLNSVIDLMAEQLTTPVHNKERIIDYYGRKVEDVKN